MLAFSDELHGELMDTLFTLGYAFCEAERVFRNFIEVLLFFENAGIVFPFS